jgi:hypothetical protein
MSFRLEDMEFKIARSPRLVDDFSRRFELRCQRLKNPRGPCLRLSKSVRANRYRYAELAEAKHHPTVIEFHI